MSANIETKVAARTFCTHIRYLPLQRFTSSSFISVVTVWLTAFLSCQTNISFIHSFNLFFNCESLCPSCGRILDLIDLHLPLSFCVSHGTTCNTLRKTLVDSHTV